VGPKLKNATSADCHKKNGDRALFFFSSPLFRDPSPDSGQKNIVNNHQGRQKALDFHGADESKVMQGASREVIEGPPDSLPHRAPTLPPSRIQAVEAQAVDGRPSSCTPGFARPSTPTFGSVTKNGRSRAPGPSSSNGSPHVDAASTTILFTGHREPIITPAPGSIGAG